jgi:HK97 gp10 family phage protein
VIETTGFDLRGLPEVVRAFREFPEKMQRVLYRRAMRAGGVVIRNRARGKIHNVSGRLRKSVRVAVKMRGTWVRAQVWAGRAIAKDDPYWALFVERGTKPHEIRPKNRKSLFIAGLMREQVKHPGAEAKPFMEPALEEGAQEAIDAIAESLREAFANALGGELS